MTENQYKSHDQNALLAVESKNTDNVPTDNVTNDLDKSRVIDTEVSQSDFDLSRSRVPDTTFFRLVKEFVTKRNAYDKKTYHNELYKLIANSGIGQMGRGLGVKYVRDINLYNLPIPTSELSSPVYAGWITAYIRTAVSELLN